MQMLTLENFAERLRVRSRDEVVAEESGPLRSGVHLQTVVDWTLHPRLVRVVGEKPYTSGGKIISIRSSEGVVAPHYLQAVLASDPTTRFIRDHATSIPVPTSVLMDIPVPTVRFEASAKKREEAFQETARWYEDIRTAPEGEADESIFHYLDRTTHRGRRAGALITVLGRRRAVLKRHRREIEAAYQPFEQLSRQAEPVALARAFEREIQAGEFVTFAVDVRTVRHDIEHVWLVSEGGEWFFDLLLRKRDPATNWTRWARNEQGGLARERVRAFRLGGLSVHKGAYYRIALQRRSQFADEAFTGTFPGGTRRTTWQKLLATQVPRYERTVQLAELVRLDHRKKAIRREVEAADRHIDRIVAWLYGRLGEAVREGVRP